MDVLSLELLEFDRVRDAIAARAESTRARARLAEGIDLSKLKAIGGKSPAAKTIDALGAQGLLCRRGEQLAATPSGRLLLERLILELAA